MTNRERFLALIPEDGQKSDIHGYMRGIKRCDANYQIAMRRYSELLEAVVLFADQVEHKSENLQTAYDNLLAVAFDKSCNKPENQP